MTPFRSRVALRRAAIITVGLTVALAPALTGLRGNDSFAQSVPVSIPSGAQAVTFADVEAEGPTAIPSPSESEDARGNGSLDDRGLRGKGSGHDDASEDRPTSTPSPVRATPRASARPTAKPARTARPSASADDQGGKRKGHQAGSSASATLAPSVAPSATEAPTPEASPSAVETESGKGRHGGNSGSDDSGHG